MTSNELNRWAPPKSREEVSPDNKSDNESDKKFKEQVLSFSGVLKAFAMSLCRDEEVALDMVQETLEKALRNKEKFEEGTNMRAWLFTILRNAFFSSVRKKSARKHTALIEDGGEEIESYLMSAENQNWHMDLEDMKRALAQLPQEQREALILVGAEGFSYEQVAAICKCPVGTIKSRVSRARIRLIELLENPPPPPKQNITTETKPESKIPETTLPEPKVDKKLEKKFKLNRSVSALVMKVAGFNDEEIAEALKISDSTVSSYVSTAKSRIETLNSEEQPFKLDKPMSILVLKAAGFTKEEIAETLEVPLAKIPGYASRARSRVKKFGPKETGDWEWSR